MNQYTPFEEENIEAFTHELGTFMQKKFTDKLQSSNHSHVRNILDEIHSLNGARADE